MVRGRMQQTGKRTAALAGPESGLRETEGPFQDYNTRNPPVRLLSVDFQRHGLKITRPQFRLHLPFLSGCQTLRRRELLTEKKYIVSSLQE